MKYHFLFLILIFAGISVFSSEIVLKRDLNLRSSANFIGTSNIIGQIRGGTTAKVLEMRTLASGTKAYRISGGWVYGSAAYIQTTEVKTEAGSTVSPCENCNENEIRAVLPLKAIVQDVESQAAVPQLSDGALKVAESLKKNGVYCDLRPEQTALRGIQCKGQLPGYPEPVRFYIPANYVKSDKNKVNIFFHGFEVSGNIYQVNPNDRKGYGDFGGRLAESENNQSILVVPESRSKIVGKEVVEMTYSKYFQDGSGKNFENFLKIVQVATDSQFAATGLAAHSGGYLPLNALLGYTNVAKSIRSAALFDGSYYSTTKITDWLNGNPENRLRLSWVTNGSVTQQTKAFIARVQRPGQLIQTPTTGTHMENIEQGGLADFLRQN